MVSRDATRFSATDCDALLMRGRWFAGLPASLRRELIGRGQVRHFPRGSWVYLQGDPPRGLWAVLEGELAFSKIGGAGSEVIYHVGGPGMWFGVVGAVTGIALGITVTALSDVIVWQVRRKELLELIEHEPHHVLPLLRLAASRAKDLLDLVEQIVRPSPRSRVAARLLLLHRIEAEHDTITGGRSLRVSQQQLALMTALSRQSISRVLHELAETGAVDVGFRRIGIRDPDALAAIANRIG
jgi:CRP/FNR family cyclic AMP-dependent transcriptional regulator